MIPAIGIMLGVYILMRVAPARLQKPAAALTAVVAVLVVVDLTLRGVWDKSIAGLWARVGSSETASGAPPTPGTGKADSVRVTKASGGSIQTPLGYGIVVAKESTLTREWIVVHDSSLPIDLAETPGVRTAYVSKQYSGEYRYKADFSVVAKQAIRAFQVNFQTFDVYGNHVRGLSFSHVGDLAAGATKKVDGEWQLLTENDAEAHYASIAYVSRVRLADGRVVVANLDPVVAEAKKFSAKFTAEDLEPAKK